METGRCTVNLFIAIARKFTHTAHTYTFKKKEATKTKKETKKSSSVSLPNRTMQVLCRKIFRWWVQTWDGFSQMHPSWCVCVHQPPGLVRSGHYQHVFLHHLLILIIVTLTSLLGVLDRHTHTKTGTFIHTHKCNWLHSCASLLKKKKKRVVILHQLLLLHIMIGRPSSSSLSIHHHHHHDSHLPIHIHIRTQHSTLHQRAKA